MPRCSAPSRPASAPSRRPSSRTPGATTTPAGRPPSCPIDRRLRRPEPPPPAAMAALAPDDAAASEGKPAAQRAAADGPLSAAEAAALVEAFRAAYEARDVDRLVELFSDDADENGVRGLDAIAANYRATLPTLSQVRYSMPSLAVKGDGPRAAVLAPFFISYRNGEGVSGEVRGQAEWALERRDGRPRIVALSYRLDPTS